MESVKPNFDYFDIQRSFSIDHYITMTVRVLVYPTKILLEVTQVFITNVKKRSKLS